MSHRPLSESYSFSPSLALWKYLPNCNVYRKCTVYSLLGTEFGCYILPQNYVFFFCFYQTFFAAINI